MLWRLLLNFWLLDGAWGMLGLSMRRNIPEDGANLFKRQTSLQPLQNRKNWYAIDMELGTPPQQFPILLDTGSSDFIIVDYTSSHCRISKCNPNKVFNALTSTSITFNNTDFIAEYSDTTTMSGTYAQDKATIGNVTIDRFNFGLATYTNSDRSIGGIGLPSNEFSTFLRDPPIIYDNFPQQLKKQGVIQHVSYSMWLNSVEESSGHILFGGLNPDLVDGDIFVFPIVESLGGRIEKLAIKLNKVFLIDSRSHQMTIGETSLPVILDSGAVISKLPLSILEPMYEALGVQTVNSIYKISCAELAHAGGIGLSFSGVEFVFPWHDIAIPLDEDYNDCVPGILPGDSPHLGENFLRTLYVVYDLERLEIAVGRAQTGTLAIINPENFLKIESTIPGIRAPRFFDSSVHWHVVANTDEVKLDSKRRIIGGKPIYHPDFRLDARFIVGDAAVEGLVNYDMWRLSLLDKTAETTSATFPDDRYPQYSYRVITSSAW